MVSYISRRKRRWKLVSKPLAFGEYDGVDIHRTCGNLRQDQGRLDPPARPHTHPPKSSRASLAKAPALRRGRSPDPATRTGARATARCASPGHNTPSTPLMEDHTSRRSITLRS
eukprot:6503181-Pyramimonas_sp.AAC.1